MRIPHNINKNTEIVYTPSKQCLDLIGENRRLVKSEDFTWDEKLVPTLTTLCVQSIQTSFKDKPRLDELPCQDRNHLLEILDVTLPLELVIPLIEDEIYWQRRYNEKFELTNKSDEYTWKRLFLERHMVDVLEKAEPQYNDEDELGEITTLCCPYVKKVMLKQLQAWKPPRYWDEEDIPEVYPNDHINFEPVFRNLKYIEQFGVVFGMTNVGDEFTWNMTKMSVLDCQRLAKSITFLKFLRVLRIHRSRMEDRHMRALMQGLVKNQTIEELDLSHCLIGDEGALCMAKLLSVHPKIRKLNLCNNKIGQIGCEGLGFVLLQENCAPLEVLDLRLNPLGEGGAMGIFRALVRGTTIEELSMAACQFEGEAGIRAGQMLTLNTSLKKLDLSNNWFDENGGEALVDGMEANRTLEWLDVRETDITPNQEERIKRSLYRNRKEYDEAEPTTMEVRSVITDGEEDDDEDDDGVDVNLQQGREKASVTIIEEHV